MSSLESRNSVLVHDFAVREGLIVDDVDASVKAFRYLWQAGKNGALQSKAANEVGEDEQFANDFGVELHEYASSGEPAIEQAKRLLRGVDQELRLALLALLERSTH